MGGGGGGGGGGASISQVGVLSQARMIGNLNKTDFDSGHWMLLAKICNMKNTMILN